MEQDVTAFRPDGHPQPDFPRALGDGNIHDVHDADAADEQAYPGNRREDKRQQVRCARDHLDHFFLGADAERFRFAFPRTAFLENLENFLARLCRVAFPDGIGVDGPDVRRRVEAFHRRLVGREDYFVLVLPEIARAFRLERADDLERNVLVAERFSDGVRVRKKRRDDRLPDDADFCHAIRLVVEHDAFIDFVVPDFEIVGAYAREGDRFVLVSDNRLPGSGDDRGNAVDVTRLFAKGDNVRLFERLRGRTRVELDAAFSGNVRHDGYRVCTHRRDLLLDGLLGTFAHGDHRDDRCDTDDNSEHGKKCPHPVSEKSPERDFKQSNRTHAEASSSKVSGGGSARNASCAFWMFSFFVSRLI